MKLTNLVIFSLGAASAALWLARALDHYYPPERAFIVMVKQSKDDPPQFYWVRVAPNGEPIATSETYTRRSDAKEAAEREASEQGAEVEA